MLDFILFFNNFAAGRYIRGSRQLGKFSKIKPVKGMSKKSYEKKKTVLKNRNK